MKYFTILFTFILCIISIPTLVGAQSNTDSLFTLATPTSVTYTDLDITQFQIGVLPKESNSNIASWKIRVSCEDDVSVFVPFTSSLENMCDNATTFTSSELESVFLFFKNNTDQLTKFNFKLKAYDANGKWLHTEKSSFSWK